MKEVTVSDLNKSLIDIRDLSNELGMDRTAAAIQSAMHLAFFEARLVNGNLKWSKNSSTVRSKSGHQF